MSYPPKRPRRNQPLLQVDVQKLAPKMSETCETLPTVPIMPNTEEPQPTNQTQEQRMKELDMRCSDFGVFEDVAGAQDDIEGICLVLETG